MNLIGQYRGKTLLHSIDPDRSQINSIYDTELATENITIVVNIILKYAGVSIKFEVGSQFEKSRRRY